MSRIPPRAQRLMWLAGATCTMLGGVTLWKSSLSGEVYSSKEKDEKLADREKAKEKFQEGKVFVVTGANSGIGREIAQELARLKGKVYMACRDMNKCEKVRENIVISTRNKFVYCRECDLASQKSIRKFVDQFRQKEEKLDVLINNAGVMQHPRAFTEDGLEIHLATNSFGPFLLTDLLTEHLKKSSNGRVVFLTNLDYRKGNLDFDDLNSQKNYKKSEAFNRSQLSMMLLAKEFSERLKADAVTVNCAYPGIVSSDIKRHMGVDKSIVGTFISNPMLWFLTKTPDKGAQTPIFLAIDSAVEKVSGKLFSKLKEIDIDPIALNREDSKRLFAVAKYWTGQVETKAEVINLVK